MLELCLQVWLAASIEGRLWNPVSGAPVRKADVMVGTADGRPVKRGVSDTNGHYLVEGLAAGRYRVAAGRSGYLPALSNDVVVLRADDVRRDVNLAMETPGVIQGHVFDSEGEPVEHVKVVALRVNGENEAAKVSRAGDGTTNDQGEYRVAGLAPGSYLLRTAATATGHEQVYGPAYYPSAEEWTEAVAVNVGRGGEAQAIDIRVGRMAEGMLSGVVHPVTALTGQLVAVRVARRATDALMTALPEQDIQAVQGDKFVISKLAPGAYTVEARAESAGGALYWALQNVVVDAGTVDTDLTLVRGLEWAAQVQPEQPLQLALKRVNGARQEADGALRFRNLTPGTWELEIRGLPASSYVERVLSGEREVMGGVVQIISGVNLPKLLILVSNAGGTVQGSGKREGTSVTLVREGGEVAKHAMAGAEGQFQIQGIRPGKYRLRCSDLPGELFEVGPRSIVKRDCGS